jgi:hypothetical protein
MPPDRHVMHSTETRPIDAMPISPASRARAFNWWGGIRVGIRLFGATAVSVLVLPYVAVPVFAPHAAAPFSGATLFNPYAANGTRWQRANFHAHSHAWGGLTSGRQSPAEVRAAYLARGYDVVGLSNYHVITRLPDDSTFLPIYEHGFSIKKTHQLIIGARHVTGLDFPLWQTTNAKQYLLNRLRDSAALTAIVHPYMRTGYDTTELAKLAGFDLLEVRSHWSDASAWWDAILSAGNPVWAIGDDDVHNVANRKETGVVWTMVNSPSAQASDIIPALRRGAMYVVAADSGTIPAQLESVSISGDTVTTRFNQSIDRIRVIADGGAVRTEAAGADQIRHVLAPEDHYARVVATTATSTIYLNPVLRSGGQTAPWSTPPVRPVASLMSRLGAALVWLAAMALLLPGRLVTRLRARWTTARAPASLHAALLVVAAAGLLSPTDAAGQSSRPAGTALPFRIGEYHEYDLKFGVVTVGSGSLSVGGPDTVRGRETLRLRYEIKGGVPFFRVHDVMESWFDATNMLSMRFTQDLNEGPKHYSRFFDFYPDEAIVLERGKPRAETVAEPLDDASFIFFVRTLKLEVGQTLSFNRYFRPNANPVTIQVLRRETITVPAGTFSTIVVKPIIRTSGIFSEGGQAELWFSDDSAHTLIQMKAKLSFGSINLYLRPSRNRR